MNTGDFLTALSSLLVQENVNSGSGSHGHVTCTNTRQLRAKRAFPSEDLYFILIFVWLAFLPLQGRMGFLTRLPKEADF